MAIDALKTLVNKIPDWLKRLDDLSGQIDRRQADLAAVNTQQPRSAGARSLRNKGSAESLKPKDDGPLDAGFDNAPLPDRTEYAPYSHGPVTVQAEQTSSGFFDELVRFTSSSRNLLRKARMAAKVAQIKRLAELEMQDDDNGSGDDRTASDSLPSLRYMSTRRLGVMSAIRRPELGGAGDDQPLDVFECLDKSLEFMQSTCEHGAHQFLREADCGDEIKKIQARMTEVLKAAEKEMERVQREDPELAKESGDVGRARARRPISIRRELTVGLKGDYKLEKDAYTTLEVSRADYSKSNVMEALNPLEVDTSEEPDEGIDVMLPKLL
ncbi:hypothetical protein OCS_05807 [Ophiocordyceps sinensis CO18]|uniref:Uncharacterized protein n=1 Tax=Ophiocordyceps sinensis (strain Co18 / CGMCC 3.14243) TaxID=911162 RepID=T5A7S8_OPHSC|nr:hypothetical protein OCS_05807 [Ophiocordyceps sinensis CO18]